MSEQEDPKPAENVESSPKLPPEVVAILKHGQEVYERVEGKPSLYPPEYTYVEEVAHEETTKPTDVMGLALLLDKYPGVRLETGREDAVYPIFAMENLRKKQIAFVRHIAERNGTDVDEIYRRDRATVDEILAKVPELLSPYEVSQASEIEKKVRAVAGQEECGVFMGKIIPNVIFARRLWEIATERLSQGLPPGNNQTL